MLRAALSAVGEPCFLALALGPIVIRDATISNAVIIQRYPKMRDVRGDSEIAWRLRQAMLGVCVAAVLVGTTAANDASPANGLHYSGTVTIDQSQQWFLASAAGRGGVLHFGGQTYRFAIAGLVAGRNSATPLRARGTVYNLRSPDGFPGRYIVLPRASNVEGKLWLKNGKAW